MEMVGWTQVSHLRDTLLLYSPMGLDLKLARHPRANHLSSIIEPRIWGVLQGPLHRLQDYTGRGLPLLVYCWVLSSAQVVVLRILCSLKPVLAVSAASCPTSLLYIRKFGHITATMAPRGFRHLKSLWHKDQRTNSEAVHIRDSGHHDSAPRPQLEGKGQHTVRTCSKSGVGIYSALERMLIDVDIGK